jgi:hypothetical protein
MARNRVDAYEGERRARETLYAAVRGELAAMSDKDLIALMEEISAAVAAERWPRECFRETVLMAAFAYIGPTTVEMKLARESGNG